MPHAREVLEDLRGGFPLFVITKGDRLDQERKIAQSGLGELFDGVETAPEAAPRFRKIDDLGQLSHLIAEIDSEEG